MLITYRASLPFISDVSTKGFMHPYPLDTLSFHLHVLLTSFIYKEREFRFDFY